MIVTATREHRHSLEAHRCGMMLRSMQKFAAAILLIACTVWSGAQGYQPNLPAHACVPSQHHNQCGHDLTRANSTQASTASLPCCPARRASSQCRADEACCVAQAPHEEAALSSIIREGSPPAVQGIHNRINLDAAIHAATISTGNPFNFRAVSELKTDLRI